MQGHEHPLLQSRSLAATGVHWIGPPPREWQRHEPLRCAAKIRYRQPDQACTVVRTGTDSLDVQFEAPQRTPTPGQFVVFLYDGGPLLGRRHDRRRDGGLDNTQSRGLARLRVHNPAYNPTVSDSFLQRYQ